MKYTTIFDGPYRNKVIGLQHITKMKDTPTNVLSQVFQEVKILWYRNKEAREERFGRLCRLETFMLWAGQ